MQIRLLITILFLSVQLCASEYDIAHLDGGPAPEENLEGGITLSENLKLHCTLEFGIMASTVIGKEIYKNPLRPENIYRIEANYIFMPVVPVLSFQHKSERNETTLKAGGSFLGMFFIEKSGSFLDSRLNESTGVSPLEAYNIFTSLSGAYFKTASTKFGFDIFNVYSSNYLPLLYADSYSMISTIETYNFTDKFYAALFLDGKDDKYHAGFYVSPVFINDFVTLTKGGLDNFIRASEMVRLFSELDFSLYQHDGGNAPFLVNTIAGIGIKPNKNWMLRAGAGYAGMVKNVGDANAFRHDVAVLGDFSFFMSDPDLSIALTFRRQLMDVVNFFGPTDNIFINVKYDPLKKLSLKILTGFQIAEKGNRLDSLNERTKRLIFRLEPEIEFKVKSFLSIAAQYKFIFWFKSYPDVSFADTEGLTEKTYEMYSHNALAYLRFFY